MTKSKVEENHIPTNQCWRADSEWYQLETAPGVILTHSYLWLFWTRLGTRHKGQNSEYSYVASLLQLWFFRWRACNRRGMACARSGPYPQEEVLAATRGRGWCGQAKIKVCLTRVGHAWRATCDKYWTSLSLSGYAWNDFMSYKAEYKLQPFIFSCNRYSLCVYTYYSAEQDRCSSLLLKVHIPDGVHVRDKWNKWKSRVVVANE